MIEGRFVKGEHYTELVANGEDIVPENKVVPIQAWTMMPKGKRKRRPEWVDIAIIVSVIAPQLYTLMFFSTLINTHQKAWMVLAAASQIWTWIVLFANYRKRPQRRQPSRSR